MTTDTPEKLDALTPHQLVAEVRQISAQYMTEVPGSRRTWPESIRQRILALCRLGVPKQKIAELTGIPPATVFHWCKGKGTSVRGARRRKGRFLELPVASSLLSNRTIRTENAAPIVGLELPERLTGARQPSSPVLVIQTPSGFRFEGLQSVEDLIKLYREIAPS